MYKKKSGMLLQNNEIAFMCESYESLTNIYKQITNPYTVIPVKSRAVNLCFSINSLTLIFGYGFFLISSKKA